MKNAVFFTSTKGNHYLYSPFRNQLRLCHPLIPHLFSLEQKGTRLDRWVAAIRKQGDLTIPGTGSFSVPDVEYQLEKYRFLKRHGFLKPAQTINIDGRLKVSDVRKNIRSVKQVIFEVTEDCNLSCTYCTYSKYYLNKPRDNRYISFEMARKTLEELIALRTPSTANHLILSFYGGEPLKNFDFIREVVEFTKRYPQEAITFTYSLTTNGLLLKHYIDFLVKHEFELSVSLDGDEAANSFRVTRNKKPTFRIVTANLEYVRDRYPGYFRDKISFLTVLHNRNSYRSVYEFFQKRYGKVPQMSDVNPANLNPLHEREFRENMLASPVTPGEEKRAIREMEKDHPKVREMVRLSEYYSGFIFRNYLEMISPRRGKRLKKRLIPTATCLPFSIRVYFSANGAVIPCEHITPFHEIGSWNAAQVAVDPVRITGIYNRYYDKISRFCRKCYFIDNCQECLFNTGVETDHPACTYYTREAGFRDFLQKHYSHLEEDYPFFRKSAHSTFHEA